ncbi:hypothetical protein H4R20_002347 [Coemansia guatemalensis]|uniref:Uncharacterized protein n=1 Tax=Coemansia guatemalensis TaxID=2761395 RepID=A0A9W8HXT1_9FUNG|nr:hypothetical protein H4R20_002347 [Coemansia guatemalensis]
MLGAIEKVIVPSLAPVSKHPHIDTATCCQLHYLFWQLILPVPDNASASGSGKDEVASEHGTVAENPLVQLFDDAMSLLPPAANDASIGNGLCNMPSVEPSPALPPPLPVVQEQLLRQRQKLLLDFAAINKPPAAEPMQPSMHVMLDPSSQIFCNKLHIEKPEGVISDAIDSAMVPAANADGYPDDGTLPEDTDLVAGLDAQPLLETIINDMLEDKSLWLFGLLLSKFAANVGTDLTDVESTALVLHETVEVLMLPEASICSIVCNQAAKFADMLDMDDIETNRDLAAACKSLKALDHNLLHYRVITYR